MEFVWAYMTAGSLEEARRIGRVLVEERLVACVNLVPAIESIYHWQGKIEEGQEAVLVAKTRRESFDALVARVRELHSYTCPCVVALPIVAGNPAYLAWLGEETERAREKP